MIVNVWVECFKLLHRRDAQAGIIIFALLPALLITSLHYSESVTFANEPTPINLTGSAISVMLSTVLAPMLVAIIAAGTLAREKQSGEIRFLLQQPHRRTTILAGKTIALVIYVITALLVALFSGLIVGMILLGTEEMDLTLTSRASETLGGLLLTYGIAGLGLIAFTAVTLLLATYFGYGATLMFTFSAIVVMGVLSQFEVVKPYLLTYAWNTANYTGNSTPNLELIRTLFVLIAYSIAGIGSAFWMFERRDIVS